MKQSRIAYLALAIALTSLIVVVVRPQPSSLSQSAKQETANERVIRTKTLRCGYIPYSYFFKLDPNTRQMSGVMYDVTNELGRLLELKIEWAEELTWATVVTSVESGRVDMLCSGMWTDTQNGRFIAYTDPIFYNGISIYGRADETRFTKIDDLNQPGVRVITRDGGTSGIIARQDFPKATLLSLPSGISDGELLEQINTNKADIMFYGDDYLVSYMADNPGKIKNLFPGKHMRVYAAGLGAIPQADIKLRTMINNAITELKGGYFIDKTLERHAPPQSWLNSLSSLRE